MKVFVLNADKTPLMPCYHRRAILLLKAKRAAVYHTVPFTIILKEQLENPVLQDVELKIDPGSKTTGIALVSNKTVIFGMNLEHRGQAIKDKLEKRAALRRGRRARKTRYRQARFLNRTRKSGWLPPSLQSRVDNIHSWTTKFSKLVKLTSIPVETVRFDPQKMQNPEISGIEYQQGELQGYDVREYLLEKFYRTCIYCDKNENVRLEVEHLTPKSRGGSNRISNLGLACHECNQAKGNLTVEEFVQDAARCAKILRQAKSPLKDAAAVNATRYAIGNMLKSFGLPVSFWSGSRTKMNRIKQNYPKDHWIDAACVGETGENVKIFSSAILKIKAMGRGTRQVVRSDAYGFPRGAAKTAKRRHGFQTGDLVKVTISRGNFPGVYTGRICTTAKTRFDITTINGKIGTTAKNLTLIQKDFGYARVA